MFSRFNYALSEPPQPTVSFELIHPQDVSAFCKSSLVSCLRSLARKYGKRLTQNHAVI
jgi:hypothetical protein